MTTTANQAHKTLKNAALAYTALVLCSTATLCHAADYYRWTDERGVVHMTDQKPENREVEVIKGRAAPPKLLSEQKREAEEAAAIDAAIAAQKEAAKKAPPPLDEFNTSKALRCEQEKERLSILQNNSVVHMQDANGNLKTLDEAQIQRELATTQKAIDALCQ